LRLYELLNIKRQLFDILFRTDEPVPERRYPRGIPPVSAVAKSLRVYSREPYILAGEEHGKAKIIGHSSPLLGKEGGIKKSLTVFTL